MPPPGHNPLHPGEDDWLEIQPYPAYSEAADGDRMPAQAGRPQHIPARVRYSLTERTVQLLDDANDMVAYDAAWVPGIIAKLIEAQHEFNRTQVEGGGIPADAPAAAPPAEVDFETVARRQLLERP